MKKYFLLIAVLVAALGVGAVKAEYSADEIAKFRAAAKQGDADAQYKLGRAYSYGYVVDKDPRKAVELWRKAAAQGHAGGQNVLGYAYMFGEGVDEDLRKAVELFRKSAAQGFANGQVNLGWAYVSGKGVDKDLRKAVELFRKSADQGFATAQAALGYAYMWGQGVRKNRRKAVEWLHKAAEQGDAYAQTNLGYAYLKGHGVRKNSRKAVEWWSKAAKQGDAGAQNSLGYAYQHGQGVAKDPRQGVEWYLKAAEQGEAYAQANLSGAYWDGSGVIQDYHEGYVWALIAKANGNESTAKWLKSFDIRYTLSASEIRSAQKEARLRLAAFRNQEQKSESKNNLPNIAAAKPPTDSTLAQQVFEKTWRSVVVIETHDAQGSGVIVRPNIVATNCHVVDNAKRIAVYQSVARRADADNAFAARVRHADKRRDFCLLDVDGLWGIAATVRKYATLKVGESVYGLGAPKGLDLSLSDGLISQLREIDGNRKIQTNVAISPGSSGGGLFDREGNLIGIMTSKITDESVEGIGFAIPADLVLRE